MNYFRVSLSLKLLSAVYTVDHMTSKEEVPHDGCGYLRVPNILRINDYRVAFTKGYTFQVFPLMTRVESSRVSLCYVVFCFMYCVV